MSEVIREFLIRNTPGHPKDIAHLTAEEFGISRQAVNRHLRKLVEEGLVIASGATKGRSYSLRTTKFRSDFELGDELQEDRIWREWAAPKLEGISPNAQDICHYGLTEILNNARDHSDGTIVTVLLEKSAAEVRLCVGDDGVGIFHKIREAFQLADEQHALLELSKGKLTTDPERHTGEGIFFASRMFDLFTIRSHKLLFHHMANGSGEGDFLVEVIVFEPGTVIDMQVDPLTRRTSGEVFDRFTTDEDGDYGFDVTHVPVVLAKYGDENLVSRSQAKRLLARFDGFKRVILNFEGVSVIGQAFADEVFRVFRRDHPSIELFPVNANAEVEKMIRRALSREKTV